MKALVIPVAVGLWALAALGPLVLVIVRGLHAVARLLGGAS